MGRHRENPRGLFVSIVLPSFHGECLGRDGKEPRVEMADISSLCGEIPISSLPLSATFFSEPVVHRFRSHGIRWREELYMAGEW